MPTLVLGYSVKSINIAEDLFGKTDGFVVPIDSLSDEYGLSDAFSKLLENENLHKETLQKVMPEYIKKSYEAAEKLKELIG